MINLGIIGLGGVTSYLHIPQALKSNKFNVIAAADVVTENPIAKRFQIQNYYTDYKELLKNSDVEAVLVSSPHHLHEEHIVAAFNAGKHVIIEKPISRNLREAQNIKKAWEQSGKVGMVAFCQRFYPKHAHVKALLDENKLGKPLSARIDHYQNFNPMENSWWRSEEKVGGGAVIGSGVHRLDLLRWFFGEAVSVYAKAVKMPRRLEAEACVHAVIEFHSGVIANFSINWAAYKYACNENFSLAAEDGSIFIGAADKICLKEVDGGALNDMTHPTCQSMYEHFAECIENNKNPNPSIVEGYKSLQLVRAIYQSVETGCIVDPSTVTF